MPAQMSEAMDLPKQPLGGWVGALLNSVSKVSDYRLNVCVPMTSKAVQHYSLNNVTYWVCPTRKTYRGKADALVIKGMQEIVRKCEPDILHVFGTESFSALAVIRAFDSFERTIIHIQGLPTYISIAYESQLPTHVRYGCTVRDILCMDSICRQKSKLMRRACYEHESFRLAAYAAGRTEWDKACTKLLSPNIHYCYCGEPIRDTFYSQKWSLNDCERHSVFMSKGTSPIKGLHIAIKALVLLKEKYPDVVLYVAGEDIFKRNGVFQKQRNPYFWNYLHKLVKRYKLERHVYFTGWLNETMQCERMRKSHVIINPASIENSANSIGEATLLGVPVVASDVGGTSSIIKHGETGFLFPFSEDYMLAHYISRIFDDDALAEDMSDKARTYAKERYDRISCCNELLTIYERMLTNESK